MRDGTRRLRVALWAAVGAGAVAGLSSGAIIPAAAAVTGPGGTTPAGTTPAGTAPGVYVPGKSSPRPTVPVVKIAGSDTAAPVRPLGKLQPADLLVVAPSTLPADLLGKIRAIAGVSSAELLDAARIKVNGGYVATLGVNPSTFREYAEKPTATSTQLWQNVADGGIAVSYLMGKQEKLPLGGSVEVDGVKAEKLPVAGFGTVGISGVDAVVSDSVARSLGIPAANAIVISAPRARLSSLISKISSILPKKASVAPLVSQAAERGLPVTAGSAGAVGATASDGPGLTAAQTSAFLTAALSRVGLPYVWGGDGPNVFDCSGLVQWSLRQAGIVMPRVAVDQAMTGPRVSLADLEPGDLLFYHTDPTAPDYISHVAIYLGGGKMEQAPEPGEDVQVVPAVFTGGFAGAIEIYPRVAAGVAADPAG